MLPVLPFIPLGKFKGKTVKQLCVEVREGFASMLNEKFELLVPGMRYAFAFVFHDVKGRFLFVLRGEKVPADYPFLDRYDFPLASRGLLPDGSFKVGGKLDNEVIKEITFLGMALEQNPAPGVDEPIVVMPCYAAKVSCKIMDKIAKSGQGILFDIEDLFTMLANDEKKITAKIMVLLEWLKICYGFGEKKEVE